MGEPGWFLEQTIPSIWAALIMRLETVRRWLHVPFSGPAREAGRQKKKN